MSQDHSKIDRPYAEIVAEIWVEVRCRFGRVYGEALIGLRYLEPDGYIRNVYVAVPADGTSEIIRPVVNAAVG